MENKETIENKKKLKRNKSKGNVNVRKQRRNERINKAEMMKGRRKWLTK